VIGVIRGSGFNIGCFCKRFIVKSSGVVAGDLVDISGGIVASNLWHDELQPRQHQRERIDRQEEYSVDRHHAYA
jgi:hypothetical protein